MSARRTTRPTPNRCSPIQGLGLGRAYRDFPGALPHADHEPWNCSAPTPFKATLQEPPIPGDASSPRNHGGAARLSRLSGRRRCHRAAWSMSITACRTITRPLERMGVDVQRQDRHRPLWRRLARTEAQAGAGARRGRLHHLFRSADDGYAVERRLSQGRDRARRRASSAARCWT